MSGASEQHESDSEEEPERLQFKVILLGDGTVGKTSIAARFTQDDFTSSYKQTIGLDFFTKAVKLPGNLEVALQVWDIGGQSIGSKMIGTYVAGTHAVVLCYDITNYDSFQDLDDWFCIVRRAFGGSAMPYVALVGNKCDLSHMRAVRSEAAHQFADENDMYCYFMSAKSGDQVDACFKHIAAHLAGVTLNRPELDSASKIVTAHIVNYEQHDPGVHSGQVPEYIKAKGACVVS